MFISEIAQSKSSFYVYMPYHLTERLAGLLLQSEQVVGLIY
jgi:hypothetical protein